MPPAVIDAMAQFRSALDAQERAQATRMAEAWLDVTRHLEGELDRLALEAANAHASGRPLTLWHVSRMERYQSLMRQVGEAIREYAPVAGAEVTEAQWVAARQGIDHSQQLISMQQPGITGQFDRLPIEAVQNMVGSAGDGTPLGTLLRNSFADAAPDVAGPLVRGVALGWHPTRIARAMRDAVNITLERAITIGRTEVARVYREASRQQYIRSGVVEGYIRVAAKSIRTCMACLLADGRFYRLEVPFEEHVNGRCTSIPKVKGVAIPPYETGEQWFLRQDEAMKRQMMGPGRFEAWKQGKFDLAALVTRVENDVWGASLQVTPLRDLLNGAGPGMAVIPLVPTPRTPQPQGTPVSSALTLPARSPSTPLLRDVMAAIDSVHGDGQLDTIPLEMVSNVTHEAAYRTLRGKPLDIQLRRDSKFKGTSLVHEVGHWLDHQQLHYAWGTHSNPTVIAANTQVRHAIQQSNAYRHWQDLLAQRTSLTVTMPDGSTRQYNPPARFMQYILEEEEVWARAYTQYIVVRSQQADLVRELADYRAQPVIGFDQWDDGDFEPIAEAIDALMEAMGWRS